MKIKELINRGINKECITEYDKNKIFNYLKHIPNAMKTDKEFKLYLGYDKWRNDWNFKRKRDKIIYKNIWRRRRKDNWNIRKQ